jgi:succinate-semialdehyde dehydrogenase/glutarate-semialdehyde dehydrogenase
VLNVVQTTTAGETTGALIKDSRLRKLSFTGSTEVGRRLLSDAAENVLRTSMELGGNAPFLVFEDADIDAAVTGAMAAKLRNMGEACTAANRFIVHEDVAAEFAQKFAAAMAGMPTGRGTEPDSKVGPLIDAKSRDKVQSLVKDALDAGASAVTGGAPADGPGYFYQPTVLTGVPASARILKEEIFGPVAPIITFGTEAEAVRLANDTEFGLVAYVFTRDLNRGLRMGELLETGMLGLNAGVISNAAAPFGGVKQSGLGREGGLEGIEEYLYTQYIGIADPYAG